MNLRRSRLAALALATVGVLAVAASVVLAGTGGPPRPASAPAVGDEASATPPFTPEPSVPLLPSLPPVLTTPSPTPASTPVATATPAPGPSIRPEDYTDAAIFTSGGAYGGWRSASVGGTKLAISVYNLARGLRQSYVIGTWEPGLITSLTLEFGDGQKLVYGPDRHRLWTCDHEDRPWPYYSGEHWHDYARAGTYVARATVTTVSCDRWDEFGELVDENTVSVPIKVVVTEDVVMPVVMTPGAMPF